MTIPLHELLLDLGRRLRAVPSYSSSQQVALSQLHGVSQTRVISFPNQRKVIFKFKNRNSISFPLLYIFRNR
jgi:hypothetical protein